MEKVGVTLTKATILAMEAGPEMDALVAERVMGSHVCTEAGGCGVNYGKRYLSDIAAAWEVVEAMQRAGWWFFVSTVLGAAFDRCDEREGRREQVPADTVPLAICRAALLTTLEEE